MRCNPILEVPTACNRTTIVNARGPIEIRIVVTSALINALSKSIAIACPSRAISNHLLDLRRRAWVLNLACDVGVTSAASIMVLH
jgi:hypothetical protein